MHLQLYLEKILEIKILEINLNYLFKKIKLNFVEEQLVEEIKLAAISILL